MLSIAGTCFASNTFVHVAYFHYVLRNRRKRGYLRALDEAMIRTPESNQLPKVSILIPAHNEEKVIEAKLRDVAAWQYPPDKVEVILIDDSSTDKTNTIAERVFSELSLAGKIVKNSKRIGVNESYNKGLRESTGDMIVHTDADAMVDYDGLLKSVKVLDAFPEAGGVTSRIVPISRNRTTAVRIEKAYRNFYDALSVAESAIHSTFPGNGPFILVRRSAFPLMIDYGSSDGNISLAIIRKGLRFLYLPNVAFYEPIPERLREQIRQKLRRSARMIQSAWLNRDILFNHDCGAFAELIFPLRMWMMLISPLLFVVGCISALAALLFLPMYCSFLLAVLLLISYFGNRLGSGSLRLLWSLLIHECYLLGGLLLSGGKRSTWRPVQRSSTIRHVA